MSAAVKVEHNVKNLYFFIRNANGAKSVLQYKKLPNSVIDMFRTEVPPELRKQGHAENLTREAFKYCLANQFKVRPTCTYVAKYCQELATPEEKSIVKV